MILLEEVTVQFGTLSVLEGVDVSVEAGEFVGLVGPNGAGKTTLVQTINGVLEPASGRVRLDGDDVESLSAAAIAQRVATLPQETHLGFAFTAEQIVEMGRTPHRSRLDWQPDTAPVEAAMERTDTLEFRTRTVDELSGGERQRVLLARALAQDPSAFVLDEPTANLDINHQIRVLDIVADLVADGRAAVAAIHDLDLAARYCDRLLLLADGEIQARGPPQTVLEQGAVPTAFDTETAVTPNPVTGRPSVTAVSEPPERPGRVHVSGTGPDAAAAIRTLWQAGFTVSLGPVPAGDRGATLASALDIEVVTVPPLQAPTPDRMAAVNQLVSDADVVVTTPGHPAVEALERERTPTVTAAVADATSPARVDGGSARCIETRAALVDAVETAVEEHYRE